MKAWKWISIFTAARVAPSLAFPCLGYLVFRGDPLQGVSVGYGGAGLTSFSLGIWCTYKATHSPGLEMSGSGS